MKYLKYFLFVGIIYLFSGCCKEVGPNINLHGQVATLLDSTWVGSAPAAQEKAVLLEDFTGVRCVNCPTGNALSASLHATYGERFISVGVHSEFLAEPYPFSAEDFRNESAEDMATTFGPIPFKPSALIDRYSYAGSSTLVVATSNWSSYVSDRMALTTPINIDLATEYIAADTSVILTASFVYNQAVSAELRYGIELIQNDIVSAQVQPDNSIDTNYVHQHVLRELITPVTGATIYTDAEAGRGVIKQFKIKLNHNEHNIPADMELVVLVHKTAGSHEVLHAKKISVM